MTYLAVGRESRLLMIGIAGTVEILHVTGGAIGRSSGKASVAMAVAAGRGLVLTAEGIEGVVEDDTRGPTGGAQMANLTLCGKSCRHVVGLPYTPMILDVARSAFGRSTREAAVAVTRAAFDDLV